jgi:RNA polymerase sigma-70 factor (ECF subfamily)
VERANQGSESALTEIFEDHHRWVFGLAFRFTGRRDDALDIMQESFSELFRRFPGFQLTGSLRSFLYPVVKHRALSLKRKNRRVVAIQAEEEWFHPVDLPADTPGDFDRIIASLPQKHREVVRLRFALDLTIGEIAVALALPVGTVKSRLHTALTRLRESFPKPE